MAMIKQKIAKSNKEIKRRFASNATDESGLHSTL
jgi:hypothetical protein